MEEATEIMWERTDLYAHHLCLSHFGRHWADRVRGDAARETGALEAEYLTGYAQAIDDIVAHLEAGEALPGGPLYARIATLAGGGRSRA